MINGIIEEKWIKESLPLHKGYMYCIAVAVSASFQYNKNPLHVRLLMPGTHYTVAMSPTCIFVRLFFLPVADYLMYFTQRIQWSDRLDDMRIQAV